MNEKHTKAIALALTTMVISGIAIFINKFAVSAIKPPLVFTATKNLGVGLFIVSVLFLTKKWQCIKKLTKREVKNLVLIGVIGGSLPFYLFFEGLSKASAVNAALIHKTLVLWVALLALPLLKEKLTKIQVLAVGVLFASNLVIGGFKGFEFSQGELMVLGATILWAVENVIAKKTLKTVDPDIVVGARMGFGTVILLAAASFVYPASLTQIGSLTLTQSLWLGVSAVTLAGYVMSWYRALKLASATLVTSILVGSTLITNLLSAMFVTHTWTKDMTLQAGLIILGVVLLISQKVKPEAREISLAEN
ncbi:MAG: DMT family transporter [Patescibacteria group bacterium]|jgi:drug/metabolite transporter (DMT)-like permease